VCCQSRGSVGTSTSRLPCIRIRWVGEPLDSLLDPLCERLVNRVAGNIHRACMRRNPPADARWRRLTAFFWCATLCCGQCVPQRCIGVRSGIWPSLCLSKHAKGVAEAASSQRCLLAAGLDFEESLYTHVVLGFNGTVGTDDVCSFTFVVLAALVSMLSMAGELCYGKNPIMQSAQDTQGL
jgi:hypothetical protein